MVTVHNKQERSNCSQFFACMMTAKTQKNVYLKIVDAQK